MIHVHVYITYLGELPPVMLPKQKYKWYNINLWERSHWVLAITFAIENTEVSISIIMDLFVYNYVCIILNHQFIFRGGIPL